MLPLDGALHLTTCCIGDERRLREGALMNLTYLFGAVAALCAIIGAFYWYKASTTPVKPAWEYDEKLQPRNLEQHLFGVTHALEAAYFWSSRSNKIAAIWTVLSGIFVLLSVIAAWFN
jgi:hypothetical protein